MRANLKKSLPVNTQKMSKNLPSTRVNNPYDEQNARIPGHMFLEDYAPNRALPGVPSAEGKFYVPLDVFRRRSYNSDKDGWIKVVKKHQRRYRRRPVVAAAVVAEPEVVSATN